MAIPWLIGAAVVAVAMAAKKSLNSDDSDSDDDNDSDDETRRQQEQEAKKQRKRKNLEKKIVNLEQGFYTDLPELIISATKVLGITPKSQDLEASTKSVFPLTEESKSISTPFLGAVGSIKSIKISSPHIDEESKFEEEIKAYRQACEKDSPTEYAFFLKDIFKFSSRNTLDSDLKLEEDFFNNLLLLEKLLNHDISFEEPDREAFIEMKNSIEIIDRYSKIRENLSENA